MEDAITVRLADFILRDMERILAKWEAFAATRLPAAASMNKSDPVPWDTELARMTVTKEAGHGDEAEEAGDPVGIIQCTDRARAS